MKRHLILAALIGMTVLGCKRKNEPNKILDPLPVNTTLTCVPAQIGQGWYALKRDLLAVLISVINRTSLLSATFPASYPELTPTGPLGEYSLTLNDRHYGTGQATIRFFSDDAHTTPIDPVQDVSSTATIKSVSISINVTGSSLFTGNESLTLTYDTAGLLDSARRLTGTSVFTGTNDSITFTMAPPGLRGAYEGLVDGHMSATGTGPGGSTTRFEMDFFADHAGNGTIVWEDIRGGIHYNDNASGYVVTHLYRLLLD